MIPFPSFRARLSAVLLLLASLIAMPLYGARAQTADDGFVRILHHNCLKRQDGSCSPVGIHNEPSRKDDDNVSILVEPFELGWWSAQWVMETDHAGTTFRNRFTNAWLTAFYERVGSDAQFMTDKWSVRLVKPGEIVTNFSTERGTWMTAPIEQFPESTRWRIITAKDGAQDIVNVSMVGERRFSFMPKTKFGILAMGGHILTVRGSGPNYTDGGSEIVPDKGEWRITKTDEFVAAKQAEKIRINGGKVGGPPMAINVETGTPSAGPVQAGWLSAQWMQEQAVTDGQKRVSFFRNVWTGKYLGVVNGAPAMMDRDAEADSKGGYAAPYGWQIVGGTVPNTKEQFRYSLKNLQTGQYLYYDGKRLGLDDNDEVRWTLDSLDAPQGSHAASEAAKTPPPVVEAPREERLVHILAKNGGAINIETGPVKSTEYQPGWWSAQWLAQEVNTGQGGRFMAFRNRWKNNFLMVRNGKLVADEPGAPVAADGMEGREEFWRVEGILEDGVILFHPRSNTYMVESNKGEVILSPTRPQGTGHFSIKNAN